MKKTLNMKIKKLALCGGLLALASLSAQAGVSLSVDSSTTLSSSSWSGSPALSMYNPNSGNSVDGNVTDGIFFKPSTAFTLGAFEFWAANGGSGASSIGNYNLSLYDLGASFSLPAGNPLYTLTGSEVDLFSAGLNVTTTANLQFDVLNFSGADQVALNAGDSYLMLISKASGDNLVMERGPGTANQALGLATVVPGAGVAINNVPVGANRTPIASFYAAPVPEPTSMALLGLGALIGTSVIRRRSGK